MSAGWYVRQIEAFRLRIGIGIKRRARIGIDPGQKPALLTSCE